jgi:hypothetical protein
VTADLSTDPRLIAWAEFERVRAEYLALAERARALPLGPERAQLAGQCAALSRRCKELAGTIMPRERVEETFPDSLIERVEQPRGKAG